jgi:hypothetical protein
VPPLPSKQIFFPVYSVAQNWPLATRASMPPDDLAAAVAKRMEEGSFIEQRFEDLAQEFGISDTRLGSSQIYSL